MRKLNFRLQESLQKHFESRLGTFGASEIREIDHPWLVCTFSLYEYWILTFTFDRGLFGFDIRHGDYPTSILNSREERWSLDELGDVVRELDLRVRLRIPDKYLEWYETGRPRFIEHHSDQR